jgi:hypothetical protein
VATPMGYYRELYDLKNLLIDSKLLLMVFKTPSGQLAQLGLLNHFNTVPP